MTNRIMIWRTVGSFQTAICREIGALRPRDVRARRPLVGLKYCRGSGVFMTSWIYCARKISQKKELALVEFHSKQVFHFYGASKLVTR